MDVEWKSAFIKLLTYDLLSLNFPVYDYMLIPSFTYPYDYFVKLRIDLECVKPEIYNNFAELTISNNRVIIRQEKDLLIRISIHKDGLNALPSIIKYLMKLIYVLCYERPT